jgi:hypothetical protein
MLDFFQNAAKILNKPAIVKSTFWPKVLNKRLKASVLVFYMIFVQEALSHVEANMTSGSLANLSHVSDVLTEHY